MSLNIIAQVPRTTSAPSFKVTPFFDDEYLINGTTYRHSFNEILIGTYTLPTQHCYIEWPWVTLSDLAKYSMTQSIARSLYDSWASCSPCFSHSQPFNEIFIFNGKSHCSTGTFADVLVTLLVITRKNILYRMLRIGILEAIHSYLFSAVKKPHKIWRYTNAIHNKVDRQKAATENNMWTFLKPFISTSKFKWLE